LSDVLTVRPKFFCDPHCDCVKHPAAAVNIGDMLQKCYHHLLFLLFSMRHYAVNWCNELRFLHIFTYHLTASSLQFAAPTCNCCNLQV